MALTEEFFRVVSEVEPEVWVLANVPEIAPFVDAPCKEVHHLSDYGLLQARDRFVASNVKLHLEKVRHKYLSREQTEKLLSFRSEAVHRRYQTTTCRYNSFTHTDAHIRDDRGIHVLSHAEAMQVQTIPFDYKFPRLPQREMEYLIGNAVPPMFAFKVACSVKAVLSGLSVFPVEAVA
jgi:site-specific DNA-cytosine methylase